MDKYSEPQFIKGTSIIDPNQSKQGLKEYQTVIEVGTSVREVKVGDIVCINPSRYAVKKYDSNGVKDGVEGMNLVTHYNFNTIVLGDKECLLIDERDVDFIVKEWEN